MPQFSTQQLLMLTGLLATFFVMRSWWIVSRSQNFQSIPITLALIVACHSGWTNRSVIAGGFRSGVAAMLSTLAIVAEISMESRATEFMRLDRIQAAYASSIELNTIVIIVFTAICFAGGIVVSFCVKLLGRSMQYLSEKMRT